MATTNAGNSQSREERLRYNGEGKPKYNSDRKSSERKEIKGRSDNKGKSDFKSKGGFKGKNSQGNRGYDRIPSYKDKDEDDKPVRRTKQTKSDSKPKEQQSDKFEIINRLEKEKKAIKKKQNDNKKEVKPPKQQARPKRSGNIDWTREYENGSYDDDDLDMYL